jgi:undecaprenyl-diphosphatase
MISPYVDIFINYLTVHSEFLSAYFPILVFFSAMIESSPGLGTITPGTLLLLFFGFSAYSLNINISIMIFAAMMGSIIGDILGYFLGKYGSDFLLKHKKLLKLSHIEEGRKFFSNHGFKSILFGKFVGPIRPIIPLIAGSISMNFSKFMYYNILSSFIWVLIYIIIGYYFGNYFREIEAFVSNISIILTLIIIAFFAYYYYFKKNKNKKNENQ